MASLPTLLLKLRRDPRLLKAPPYLSALLVAVGVVWLLLLPLNEYSRSTYISENALLPGQVHTYFGGSEHNVFYAYRSEFLSVADKPQAEITSKLLQILKDSGLKTATQNYKYNVGGKEYGGQNVYGILHAPRGDATEAIVLVAALRNTEDELNVSGVPLVLTLARYFRRWSLWSKDIIFLFPGDSKAGPQAWVEAYHDSQHLLEVEPLPLKSGALEGAVVVDNPKDVPFAHLHITYDGINGQLPNLDLFNTAVSVAGGQHSMGVSLQKMFTHTNSYLDRLRTMLRGMANQGLGHATGPHSSFIPYHVDAITLSAIGDGWQDNMALGRVVESLFRSLNNLMEHFHQSFFLYLLMQTHRFVSIGTYLPSAMAVAGNFSIMAIALWVASGRPPKSRAVEKDKGKKAKQDSKTVKEGSDAAAIPKQELKVVERHIFAPAVLVVSLHFLGVVPLFMFNNLTEGTLAPAIYAFTGINAIAPLLLRPLVRSFTRQQMVLLKCFSLLLLGMFLATLATINFSLSFLVGLLAAPLTYVGASCGEVESADAPAISTSPAMRVLQSAVLHAVAPPVVFLLVCVASGADVGGMLMEAAFGWHVWGLWTQVIVWCVWWPAWMAGALSIAPLVL